VTEVRIRHATDANSRHLGDVPFSELDTVIPTLHRWGVADYDGMVDFIGQFTYDDQTQTAYFEVIMEEIEG
jgi:hypothetical protein